MNIVEHANRLHTSVEYYVLSQMFDKTMLRHIEEISSRSFPVAIDTITLTSFLFLQLIKK